MAYSPPDWAIKIGFGFHNDTPRDPIRSGYFIKYNVVTENVLLVSRAAERTYVIPRKYITLIYYKIGRMSVYVPKGQFYQDHYWMELQRTARAAGQPSEFEYDNLFEWEPADEDKIKHKKLPKILFFSRTIPHPQQGEIT